MPPRRARAPTLGRPSLVPSPPPLTFRPLFTVATQDIYNEIKALDGRAAVDATGMGRQQQKLETAAKSLGIKQ